jgi:hypothetical protein
MLTYADAWSMLTYADAKMQDEQAESEHAAC